MMQKIRWFLFNAGIYALVILAIISSNPGFLRVSIAATWVISVISIGCMMFAALCVLGYAATGAKYKGEIEKFKVPGWVDFFTDAILAGFMVYHGWIWTPMLWIMHAISNAISRTCINYLQATSCHEK